MDSNLYDQIFQANFAQINGDYETAVQQYTIILAQKESYEILIEKIIALTHLYSLEFAIKECENAIILNKKRYEGYFRRGICQFLQSKHKAAMIDFEEAIEKLGSKSPLLKKQIELWVCKCKAEIDNKSLNDQLKNQKTEKIENEQQQPKPEQQEKQQTAQQPDKTKLEVEDQKKGVEDQKKGVQDQKKGVEEQKKTEKPVSQQTESKTAQLSQSGKIIYTWYQTQYKVGIEISYALQSSEKLKSNIQPKKLEISFPVSDGTDYQLNLDLFDEIIPEKSKVTAHISKIEILLQKKDSNKNWSMLEAPVEQQQSQESKTEEKDSQKNQQGKPQSSNYPSSSKQKKDWDKIDLEVESDISKNREQYEEGDQFQNFMKVLYQNADENTRRAMIKSYQTSGGTVLSTNWDEVAKKDYTGKDRPEPPKGQEYKKWDP